MRDACAASHVADGKPTGDDTSDATPTGINTDTAAASDDDSDSVLPQVLPAPTRRRRAGRNMATATTVGVGLAAVAVSSLFLRKEVFVGVVVLAVVVGSWELATVLRRSDVAVPLVPVALGAAVMQVAAYLGGGDALVVALGVTVFATAAWRLLGPASGYARDLTAAVFIVMYLGLLAGFATLLVRPEDGPWRVLAFVALVVCSDLGGFALGVLFGRHPMAPTVSPKKSWEGFVGSVVACVAGGVLIVGLAFDGAWWQGAVVGVAVVCSATLGDLGESMIKRDLGVKDMSNVLPGHGGVMDRLDSLLVTAPVVWLLLTAFVPPT